MAKTLHTLYAMDIDDVLFDQIQDWSLNTAIAEILQGGDGSVDPTFVAVGSQAPGISFATTGIATALAKCGISGFKVTTGAVGTAFFHKLAEGGTREGATSHIKCVVNEGLLVPRTLSASRGGVAVLTYDLIATWNGTNDPVVITASQSLAGTPAVSALWVEGPCSINGTALEDVQGITIDFGLQEIVQGGDGQVWPTFAAVMSRAPSIRIATNDVEIITTVGLSGVVQATTDSVVYFRKVAEGATRVANATAEHIKFTIDEGRISTQAITGSHGALLGTEVVITPTYDGTNAILVISTASAIT